jgi:hypothetical protein
MVIKGLVFCVLRCPPPLSLLAFAFNFPRKLAAGADALPGTVIDVFLLPPPPSPPPSVAAAK